MASAGVFLYTIFVFIFRADLAKFLTKDERLQVALEETYKVYAISLISDGTQCWLGGAIRGLNKQEWATKLGLVVYYPICLPLVYIFGFALNMQTQGLWLGISLA